MVYLSEPKEIISEFLRAELTDPRGRHSTATETFDGDGSTQEFTLTPPSGGVKAITSISISSVDKKKWQDYQIDLDNGFIYFLLPPAIGVGTISVTYKYGTTTWIYPDFPRTDLSLTSYPRLAVSVIGEVGHRAGNYQACVVSKLLVQIDVFVKEKYSYNDGNRVYAETELARFLLRKAELPFNNSIDELYPKLWNYSKEAIRSLPFDEDRQTFRGALEISLNGVDVGE